MSWPEYVRAISGGAINAEIAKRAEVTGPSVSRWFSQGSMPDPATAARLARSYDRPVLEAFVAAGFLTSEEAGERPSAPPSLASLTDGELIEEVGRRMKELRDAGKPPQKSTSGAAAPGPQDDDPHGPIRVTDPASLTPAARHAASRGKMDHEAATTRAEESQDDGGMDPA